MYIIAYMFRNVNKIPMICSSFIQKRKTTGTSIEIPMAFFHIIYAFCSLAAVSVFFRSMVMVIGPTPPGTGVI